jgi:hypothetical protein
MTTQDGSYFRFLDLPVELRLMVYDSFSIRKKQHTMHAAKTEVSEAVNDRPSAVMVSHHVSVQILRILRVLQHEAQAIISHQVDKAQDMMPRVMFDGPAIDLLHGVDSVITHITWWLEAVHKNLDFDINSWLQARRVERRDEVRQFMQQAAVQMLAQWQKFRRPYSSRHRDQTTILFACRVNNDPGHPTGVLSYDFWPPGMNYTASMLRKVLSYY